MQEGRVGRSHETAEFNHPRNAQTSSHWAEIEAFGRRADRSLDGGFRHVILDMISALRIERDWIADFGGQLYINPSVVTVAGTTVVTRDVRLTDDMVRVGMNLKFNWGWQSPVVAKY